MFRILKLNESDAAKDLAVEPGSEEEAKLNQVEGRDFKEEFYALPKEEQNKYIEMIPANQVGMSSKVAKAVAEEFDLDEGILWWVTNFYKFEESDKSLTEAEDDEEVEDITDDLESAEEVEDTIDSEEDQEENPVEEKSQLDKQLDELREILVDLDLNLYQIISKENKNDVIYIIGKVAENSNDTLMLIDTKPEEINNEVELEEPIIDNVDLKDGPVEETVEGEEDIETPAEQRFDFVVLPKTFDEINKLNPRYGDELTPDHEAIIEYLMNCLVELNPEAAEELQKEEPEELPIPEEIPGEEDLEDED